MAKVVMYAKTQEDIDKIDLNNCVILSPEFFESFFPWENDAQSSGRIISDAKVVIMPIEGE